MGRTNRAPSTIIGYLTDALTCVKRTDLEGWNFVTRSVVYLTNAAYGNKLTFRFYAASGRLVPSELSIWLETFNVLSVGNAVDLL